MGAHDVLILRNHGLLTVGRSVAEAFDRMFMLNMACQIQIDAMQSGGELVLLPQAVCELTARQYAGEEEEDMDARLHLIWQACLRLVEGATPDYRA